MTFDGAGNCVSSIGTQLYNPTTYNPITNAASPYPYNVVPVDPVIANRLQPRSVSDVFPWLHRWQRHFWTDHQRPWAAADSIRLEVLFLKGRPARCKRKSPSCWTGSGFFAASSEGAAAGTRTAPSPIVAVRAAAKFLARDAAASGSRTQSTKAQSNLISAAVPSGGNSPAGAASCGSAGPAAAEHCEAARRNSRKLPPEDLARAASAPARHTPGSNTAPSNRADIASCFSSHQARWAGGGKGYLLTAGRAQPKKPNLPRGTRRTGRIVRRSRLCVKKKERN